MITGYEKVKQASQRLNLPLWWVERVVIEYLPCRQFLKDGEFCTFDFNIIKGNVLQEIRNKKVIISNSFVLIHNIASKDIATRIILGLTGTPMAPLASDVGLVIPNGLVSQNYVPFVINSIETYDPKLDFSEHAIFLDDGQFYQFKISRFGKEYHPSPFKGWFKSELFDLEPLRVINDEIQDFRNNPFPSDTQALEARRNQLREKYQELENIRSKIRNKLLEWFEPQKVKELKMQISYQTELPPTLTHLDSFNIVNGKQKVRSYMEPLLYRAARKNLADAKEAVKNRKKDDQSFSILEEMEASAITIITAATCLEAYINSIIQDFLPTYWNILKSMTLRQKWFFTPYVFGCNDCFEIGADVYNKFNDLVEWRNDLIHFKFQFEKIAKLSDGTKVSMAYSICNCQNAEIAVETVVAIIKRLSEKTPVPIPFWLNPSGEWLKGV